MSSPELPTIRIDPHSGRAFHEYRTEVIPFAPGLQGRTTQLLNVYAEQGWRLVSSHLVPAGPRVSQSLGEPEVGLGVFVVLERAKR